MNRSERPLVWLASALAVVGVSTHSIRAQPPSAVRRAAKHVDGRPVAEILQRLGARLERGVTAATLRRYTVQFDRTDPDRDGKHTREEYVERGRYLTAQARAGIFRAADGNADGVVTRSEYVLNRIITDEAKEIVEAMDDDRNRQIERSEFIEHATVRLADRSLAEAVYAALDANRDGNLITPEYLRIWGTWARAGRRPAQQRIETLRTDLANTPGAARTAPAPPTRRRPAGSGPPAVAQVFARFDANGDGKLKRNEVPDFVQQFIFPADANQDDSVTTEELQAWRRRQPQGRGPAGPAPPDRTETERNGPRREGPADSRPPGRPTRRARGGLGDPDEFVARALQFDQDGDGKLDRGELLKMAQGMARRRGGRGEGRGNRGFERRTRGGFGGPNGGRRPGGERRRPPRPAPEVDD
ncbi:MAG: hypothetical protein CMJ59_07200 [Planctomycetaceae bacterium]|nr:hypothetical protein [Planctomycetaceae bacterium]